MNQTEKLSNVTRVYLRDFEKIFCEMRRGMTGVCLGNSISANFIFQMIPHHQGAINMCRNLLRYTTCIPLQEIALGIIREQTESIEQMKKALPCCRMLKNTPQELCAYQQEMDRILCVMFEGMEGACADNGLSDDFMREMIPHHEGAVRMSENALKQRICKELCPILDAIIASQTRGIRQMRTLLQDGICSCGGGWRMN